MATNNSDVPNNDNPSATPPESGGGTVGQDLARLAIAVAMMAGIVLLVYLAKGSKPTALDLLQWAVAIFFVALEVSLIYLIWTGRLQLTKLLCESDGKASMSRLQLLIFTFVIGALIFLMTLQSGADGTYEFPQIPKEILWLLGISVAGYSGGKFLQKPGDKTGENKTGADTQPRQPGF